MCGIGGASCAKNEQLPLPKLAQALAEGLVVRGRDATGTAWATPDGQVWYHKLPVSAWHYPAARTVDHDARNLLVHTRMGTHGSPSDNRNNHPIVLPGIVGIHNGIVSNVTELFDLYDAVPTAEVDSEAIFAALGHRPYDVHPTEVLALIQGMAAVAWIETPQPETIRLARVDGRPLWLGHTRKGSTVFASTESILKAACRKTGVKLVDVWEVPIGTYVRVKNGIVVEMADIPFDEKLAAPAPYWRDRYADRTGGYTYDTLTKRDF